MKGSLVTCGVCGCLQHGPRPDGWLSFGRALVCDVECLLSVYETSATFEVDGEPVALAALLRANQHDTDVSDWILAARVGDERPEYHGLTVRRVS